MLAPKRPAMPLKAIRAMTGKGRIAVQLSGAIATDRIGQRLYRSGLPSVSHAMAVATNWFPTTS